RVLVTGVAGQLGYDVVKELNKRGYTTIHPLTLTPNAYGLGPNLVIGVDRSDFDITDAKATEDFIFKVMPDAVIHCAAYTAVDAAEDNVKTCRMINVDGTENIAKVCAKIGAKMLYISTDYVFGDMLGARDERPHEVDDEANPLNIYGQSKLDGELAVKKYLQKYFIVRTSWVFGKNGNNFVKTMLRLGKEREQLTVVNDQVGSPTYTVDLARLCVDMILTDKYGTYHGTNEGYCSWAEFATEIMKQAGLQCKIVPITSAEYPTKAKRPFNSRLSKDCLDKNGFERLPKWQDALREYLGEINEQV
ncbi:MAG: dTDP-4-dehydrorhamnose reductase, partial [Phascolarctobacterium sp.]|nr:dTDP-4-dehydrorhamnose reductase [Candidatus Phascolarctobacterium equi]